MSGICIFNKLFKYFRCRKFWIMLLDTLIIQDAHAKGWEIRELEEEGTSLTSSFLLAAPFCKYQLPPLGHTLSKAVQTVCR